MIPPLPTDGRRAFLKGRIDTMRAALDLLWTQVEKDHGHPFYTIGRGKRELIDLEAELRGFDRLARGGLPVPLPVALALVVTGQPLDLPPHSDPEATP
jgi:hypothetical protein